MNNRRTFIASLGLGLVGSAISQAERIGVSAAYSSSQNAIPEVFRVPLDEKNFVLPKGLREGATVAVTAPASGINPGDATKNIALLKSFGLNVIVGQAIYKRNGYLSAPDEDRAAEFMEFVERKDIDCIMCARGGYGVMRILPMLDFETIRKNPKIIIGYSDITALLIAITTTAGIVTYHGPVASSEFDDFTTEQFKKTLFSPTQVISKNITNHESSITITKGKAKGRLVGGNLSMIVSTLGTPYEIDTRGAILFIEEVEEEPYKIDRMLTQLWLAGKLQTCAGFAIGQFKNCETKNRTTLTTLKTSLKQVLEARIGTLGVPAVYGLPFGHVRSKMTLPLGILAELDADEKVLSYTETAVLA